MILSENVCPSNGTTIYSPNLRVDDIVMTVNTTADGTLVVQERIDEPLYTVTQWESNDVPRSPFPSSSFPSFCSLSGMFVHDTMLIKHTQ